MVAEAIQLDAFAGPGALVAPQTHQGACDVLLESLVARGFALIEGPKWFEDDGALNAFWAGDQEERNALQPLQPVEGAGYRELEGDRQLLEHRMGPWMARAPPVLESLKQASEGLDGTARHLLAAALRGQLLRLPGSALSAALDDTPLAPHIWAASGMQCFRYGPTSAGCEAHVDKGLLTLIWAPAQPGLEVCDPRGAWQAVPPTTSRQLVVVPGHTLEYATCGLIKAAQHRVTLGPGQGRRSVAYKLAANPAATVNLLPALQGAGHMLPAASKERYPQPSVVRSIVEGFAATHRCVNTAVQRQAKRARTANAGPEAPAAGAEAAAGPSAAAGAAQVPRVAAPLQQGPGADDAAQGHAAAAAASGIGVGIAEPAPARQPSHGQAEQAPILIVIRDHSGQDATFRVLPTFAWSKIMAAYCAKRGFDPAVMRFVFDGCLICPTDTPALLGMEDGDEVNAFSRLAGD